MRNIFILCFCSIIAQVIKELALIGMVLEVNISPIRDSLSEYFSQLNFFINFFYKCKSLSSFIINIFYINVY